MNVKNLGGGQKPAGLQKAVTNPTFFFWMSPLTIGYWAIEWLENFLSGYKKCVMLISHDRFFLDRITNKTLEIENCECQLYNGNYSEYLKKKAANREIQQKHYELQQREIARMEEFIEQQKKWNREKNLIAARSRQKAIDRMDKIDKPKDLPQK